jgi:hypothetical protein
MMKIKRETWIIIALLLVVIVSCMFMGSNIYEGAVTMVSAQKNSAMRVTYANQFKLINESMKKVRTSLDMIDNSFNALRSGLNTLKPMLKDVSGIPMPVDPSNVPITNVFTYLKNDADGVISRIEQMQMKLKMDASELVSRIEQLRNMAYPIPVNIQPAPPKTDTSYNKTDASYN